MSGQIGCYSSRLELMNLFCNKHGMNRHLKSGKRWKCAECISDYSYEYRRKQKQRCVDYKGGCCMKCGYNASNHALHLHHRVPEEKSFDLSSQNLAKSWGKLKDELDKCDLLCMNCHFEEHERIDHRERSERKKKMIPDIQMHKKEMHRYNCKILGIRPSP